MGDAAMAIADVRRRMKNIRAQLKRRREKDSEAIGQALSSEVLMVYVFSGNDLDAAAEFVRLQKPALSESLDKRRRAVEHIYAQTPVDELAELTNDDCLARYSCKKMVSSCRFIAELRLYQWLVAQNCEHGVAPSRLQMVRCALHSLPDAVPWQVRRRAQRPLLGPERVQRKWLQRFRSTWDAKLGKLEVVHTTPQHVVQEKETSFVKWSGVSFGLLNLGPFWV